MLIQIGPPKDPSDAVNLLLKCHERIRYFIDFLRHLDMEEKLVLSAIRHFLTLEEQAAILRELRARRSELHVH